jgi:hypothetical protein
MTVLPPEIRVRRIFQHSQVGGGRRLQGSAIRPSVRPSLCYDSPRHKSIGINFYRVCGRELSWKHTRFADAFNFGQSLWDKMWCYYKHLWEHFGNLMRTWWKHIGNITPLSTFFGHKFNDLKKMMIQVGGQKYIMIFLLLFS